MQSHLCSTPCICMSNIIHIIIIIFEQANYWKESLAASQRYNRYIYYSTTSWNTRVIALHWHCCSQIKICPVSDSCIVNDVRNILAERMSRQQKQTSSFKRKFQNKGDGYLLFFIEDTLQFAMLTLLSSYFIVSCFFVSVEFCSMLCNHKNKYLFGLAIRGLSQRLFYAF